MIAQIKKPVKKWLAHSVYELHRHDLLPNPLQVHSVDETLDVLLNTNKSMVRFGDSDLVMISGRNTIFQTAAPEITEGLRRIIGYQYDDLIVTIPDIFGDLDIYLPASRAFWEDHLLFFRKAYYKYCNTNKVYYNTTVSRGYVTLADKSRSGGWFEKFRRVFDGKDLVMVEGCTAHNGVGNDLFSKASSVQRIVCPSSNAYRVRDRILEECLKFDRDKLFLFALGVTAKALVEEMFLKGYRVIDIGNLDMEYEWFLRKAVKKEPIPKHSIVGEKANRKAGYEEYLSQIVCYIE
ncbi:MAG TPA: DUF1792 domain-containing protein [Candidatus Eisenbergiella merdipullorum]|uniref:DUF1792 domain-containing protein n=1 Tax=Candidatus Eisenbergiella merdipullorum TaxID=2838553 RepID=A0A9D2I5K1_9FIRM|nr:DUF1792 domain-containing protein [Candidatus Eisenbergiella merdipullorum]